MPHFVYDNTGPVECPAAVDYTKVKGKTVIITGVGSNGLGEAYVNAFADNGLVSYLSFCCQRRPAPARDALRSVQVGTWSRQLVCSRVSIDFRLSVLFVKCDASSWEDQVALFEIAKARSPQGGIDIVIANAGIFKEDLFFVGLDSPAPTKPNLKMMDVNIYGVFYTAKLAAHYFSQQLVERYDRCLILIGSVMSYLDTYGAVGYGLSKHAVRGLMGVLRRRGLMRVNMLAPWYTHSKVNTPEFNKVLEGLFASQGLSFARVEDAVKAVMRIATDPTLNGHALSNVPTVVAPSGYVDLGMDDFQEGTLLDRFQKSVAEIKYGHMVSPQGQK
ncbi:uncharacterized protein Z519_01833 [Cladophialophora bantiana CBS 173.52]|uniref:Uncharacterized protein n=1 Tax=Cladophialophora bantiana (strain ATCC 10958 / CBS 173.52 / CDC B-1940 / NIH 8579) TaxID=1442370 RepID=A0A0D2IN75_CLAB1|nr:uncharacterized protein Z519_01833 [Cladophialophora bantiana CBS 173.52]KIW98249.1 hypothetical protein Z519_01833 [Cladophialophora bantiana CBS 173.52]